MLVVDVTERTFELLFVADSQILEILLTFWSVSSSIFFLSYSRTKRQLISWSYIRSNAQEKSLTACFRPQVAPLYSPYAWYSLYWSFNLHLLESPRSLNLEICTASIRALPMLPDTVPIRMTLSRRFCSWRAQQRLLVHYLPMMASHFPLACVTS